MVQSNSRLVRGKPKKTSQMDAYDALPVNDTAPALRPHSPEKKPGIDVTVSENAVCALVAELEATLAGFSPSDEREEKHKEGLAEWVNALFFADRIVLEPSETEPDASAAEPIKAESGQ